MYSNTTRTEIPSIGSLKKRNFSFSNLFLDFCAVFFFEIDETIRNYGLMKKPRKSKFPRKKSNGRSRQTFEVTYVVG